MVERDGLGTQTTHKQTSSNFILQFPPGGFPALLDEGTQIINSTWDPRHSAAPFAHGSMATRRAPGHPLQAQSKDHVERPELITFYLLAQELL